MDSNLMSCPTCGHSVSNAAGACAYCGAMMTENEQQPTEEIGAVDIAQPDESTLPSFRTEETAAAAGSEPSGPDPIPVADQPIPPDLQELSPSPPEATAAGTDAEPEVELTEKQEPTETADQQTSIEAEPEMKAAADIVPLPLEGKSESTTPATEDIVPENPAEINEIAASETMTAVSAGEDEPAVAGAGTAEPVSSASDTVSPAEEVQVSPEPVLPEAAVDEPPKSEVRGDNIIELAEVQNIQEELEKVSTPVAAAPSEISAEVGDIESPEAAQPIIEAEIPIDVEADPMTESAGDTIILEVTDEVQSDSAKVPQKSDEFDQTSAAAEALKIEKAAQDMAAAIKKQKAALADPQMKPKPDSATVKAQAIKAQKAALAKVRAAKKQKMILAKAAALKRKKAAQAKAQARKKPAADRNGVENAGEEGVVTLKDAAPTAGKAPQETSADSKLKNLLERYKGRSVGINYDNSADIREAQLVEANGEYFSVYAKEKNLKYSYPLKTILTVIEGKDGVEAGESGKKSKFNAVIKIYPLVLF
ncbi:MAG: hypothetical protein QNJ58_10595 [Desulfobacterales bacterium]|nr:hypothetical protein [Desulfobacterales bacterium]